MNILVTGSTGFLGRRLVAEIRERWPDASIHCLVKAAETPAEGAAFSQQKREGAAIIFGDLAQRHVTDAGPPETVDYVFHLAANIDTAASEESARVNDLGTARLLDWLGPRLRGARVVFTSTVAVCDPVGSLSGPVDETSPCTPRTAYGRAKLAAEALIRDRAATDGYTYTIFRLPTLFGAGETPRGPFDLLIRSAHRDSWLGRLNWPGRASVVHVDDVVRVLVEAPTVPGLGGDTFCVATEEAMTLGEILRRMAALAGRSLRPIDLSPRVWRSLKWIAQDEGVAKWVPEAAQHAYWRLSLFVADGFLQDGRKLRSVLGTRLRPLDERVNAMRHDHAAP